MKTLFYIIYKYWSKHKKSLVTLLFSGVLLCAVVCCAFLILRGNFHRRLQKSYDALGYYTIIIPSSETECIQSLSTDQTVSGQIHCFGKMGTAGKSFEYGMLDDPYELAHIPLDNGRLPEKEGEIAIDTTALAKMGYPGKVGDSITLDKGKFILVGIIGEDYGKGREWSELTADYEQTHDQNSFLMPVIFICSYKEKAQYSLTMLDNINTDYDAASTNKYTFSKYGFMQGHNKEKTAKEYASGANTFMAERHLFVFGGLCALIAVLSIVAVLKNIFSERKASFDMLRKVGFSKSDIRTIYDIECLIFIIIQTIIGIIIGITAYLCIYYFQVHILDMTAYSGLTDYDLVTKNTASPYAYSALASCIVMPLGYIFASLTSKLKVRHKSQKTSSLSKSFAKTFSTRSVTIIQFVALTLICLGTLIGYMSITDNGKEFLPDLGYHPVQTTQFGNGFSFEEDNMEEYYSVPSPNVYGTGNFKIATISDIPFGCDDDTAGKLSAMLTGSLPGTFIMSNSELFLRTTIGMGSLEDKEFLRSQSSEQGKALIDSENKLYAMPTKLADISLIKDLEKYVVSGSINAQKLNAGKEIIFVASDEKYSNINGSFTLCSAAGNTDFGIDEVVKSDVKIGAVVILPKDMNRVLKYCVKGSDDYNFLTTVSGAKQLKLHNAAYTEIFSAEHIDGGLIPMTSGMVLTSYSQLKSERFISKATSYGGTVMIIVIMSLLGFAAYWGGIDMKIRIKEYEISVLRAVGTPIKTIRRRLLIDSIKIPMISSVVAFIIVRIIQQITSKVYDIYINAFWEFNNRFIEADAESQERMIGESFTVDAYRDKLHYNFFLDDELWKVNPVIPIIIIFAVMCIITILLTQKSFKRFTPDIASSLAKGRKRQ